MEQLDSRELLRDTSMMRELHESAMSSAMNIVGQSGVHAVHVAPPVLFLLTSCSSDVLDRRGRQLLRSPEMCSATKDEVNGSVWSLSPCPRPPISVDPPTAHPTPLSIAGVMGEVSCQKVAPSSLLLRIPGKVYLMESGFPRKFCTNAHT
jgi:hypothetical protein